jgi:hypothetical protein
MVAQGLDRDLESTLMTEAEAAHQLGFSTRALQCWRKKGIGPKFVRVAGWAIRYRTVDVAEWLKACRFQGS